MVCPSFYKHLIDDFSTSLRLPADFVRKYHGSMYTNMTLRTRSRKTWAVKLESADGEWFFTAGWTKFAKSLKLNNMKMAVFSLHVDEATFDVSVFDTNNCELDNSALQQSEMIKAEPLFIYDENMSEGERPPLFEVVLTKSQRSRLVVREEFVKAAGLEGERAVVLQFPPLQRYWAAVLLRRNRNVEFGAGWSDFITENGLVFGRTYSFEFDSAKNLILVKVKKD